MKLRTIKQLKNLKGKRVLVRSDFNVDIKNGKILDDERVERALPTYKYLLSKGAKIVSATHLGRPLGFDKKLSVAQVGKHLSKLLKKPVKIMQDVVGEKVKKAVSTMKPGEIVMLENTRFYKEDQKGDKKFAKKIASLADVYVNDAFGASHRADASIAVVAKFLPTYAGLLMAEEVKTINQFIEKPKRPFVFVIGGAKLSTKIHLIHELLDNADHILIGGALANTFLKMKGIKVGKSFVEEECKKDVLDTFRFVKKYKDRIVLPVDVVIASSIKSTKAKAVPVGSVPNGAAIFDIGPKTVKLFSGYVSKAKTVVFNGAMGVFENEAFSEGTKLLYKNIAHSKAQTLAGGGETILALDQFKLSGKINYISTGGGAMLNFIERAKMPGIEVIPHS